MSPRSRLVLSFALASLALQPPALARGGERDERRASPAGVDPAPDLRAARVLRAARATPRRPAGEIVEELAQSGPTLVDSLLDILVRRAVPPLEQGGAAQTLSDPQREYILAALGRWDPRLSISGIEARVSSSGEPSANVAALWVYSAVGDATHVERLIELALDAPGPGPGDAPALAAPPAAALLEPHSAAAFRAAVGAILARDGRAFESLARRIDQSPNVLCDSWVAALGAARDPRGLAALARLLDFRPELAGSIVPVARTLGASPSYELNEDMARVARPYLSDPRPQVRAAAARLAAELEDEQALPRLIGMLDDADVCCSDAALWSLRRISRLDYAARPELWRSWYGAEERWWSADAPKLIADLARGAAASRGAALDRLCGRSLYRDEIAVHVADALLDRDARVRRRACEGLGQLGTPTVYEALLGALEDEDDGVRKGARAALVRIAARELPDDPAGCRAALRL